MNDRLRILHISTVRKMFPTKRFPKEFKFFLTSETQIRHLDRGFSLVGYFGESIADTMNKYQDRYTAAASVTLPLRNIL